VTTPDSDWRDFAACRDADPELFFPLGTTGLGFQQTALAQQMCRSCPAREECLSYALDNGITDGVWGGTTEEQRRRLARTVVA
jgi:WhiB family redox-sensing transcriptional regulator